MDKKHKPTASFAGGTSSKNTKVGSKKIEKSHIPQKSNANLDKKSHTQVGKTTHKQPEAQKKTTPKEEEKEKPQEKTQKAVTQIKSTSSNLTSQKANDDLEKKNYNELILNLRKN